VVIFVTGSKGKTTTTEVINTLLENGGYRTALSSGLRFKVFDRSIQNKYKMSVPGRGILQKFLRHAVREGCDVAIMEMSSQAVLDHRHRFLFPNALVFTNLEPEHIEAHGSYENYVEAKLKLAQAVKKSPKHKKAIVANLDDKEGRKFVARSYSHTTNDCSYSIDSETSRLYNKDELRFTYRKIRYTSSLKGLHNLSNILAAIKIAEFMKVPSSIQVEALAKLNGVRGRLEEISESSKLGFATYVDYAHTPESLRAIYNTFSDKTIIGVLGNAGGGRDTWKRPKMATIVEEYCDHIILTDEDPYDEDPRAIVDEMYQAIEDKSKVLIEMDRRKAIRQGLEQALRQAQSKQKQDVVLLVTGKGTDPFIMRATGEREPWDDATVIREEIEKLMANG
jgi:UDP-N-acetylmuramoyl-L-alanyl-D-glutamate--2,6-diaminopimelate ligase